MGLDMYLTASKYVGGWSHSSDEQKKAYDEVLKVIGLKGFRCEGSPSLNVEVMVGYWRKANAIHNWFVQNCQDGVDECQRTYVERTKLEELRDLCKKVLSRRGKSDEKDEIEEKLPPAAGFFFGTTDIDEWYWRDLEDTVEIIDDVLNNVRLDDASLYYQSSW